MSGKRKNKLKKIKKEYLNEVVKEKSIDVWCIVKGGIKIYKLSSFLSC